jgi:hypothetical protein
MTVGMLVVVVVVLGVVALAIALVGDGSRDQVGSYPEPKVGCRVARGRASCEAGGRAAASP